LAAWSRTAITQAGSGLGGPFIEMQMNPLLKLALEMGPLLIFFLVNSSQGLFVGTGAFMVAIVVALAISYGIARTVPVMPLVTAVFVLIFGGLTLLLADELFIKLKPTIVNLLFATILFVGLATGRMFIKILLESAFQLSERGWLIVTKAWIGFFIFLAVLNEVVWRNVSTDTWVSFKVFGVLPITLAFSFALLPVIMRHSIEVKPAEVEKPKNTDGPS
jgi:intracellular septation protein